MRPSRKRCSPHIAPLFRCAPYRCDRCRQFHLTSRTKGKRVPRPLALDPQ